MRRPTGERRDGDVRQCEGRVGYGLVGIDSSAADLSDCCVREKRGNRVCAVPQTRAEGCLDEMERWLSLFTSSLYAELV